MPDDISIRFSASKLTSFRGLISCELIKFYLFICVFGSVEILTRATPAKRKVVRKCVDVFDFGRNLWAKSKRKLL